MPWTRFPGLPGRVYVPAPAPRLTKKHDCPDCIACQNCAEERCRICRAGRCAADERIGGRRRLRRKRKSPE
jgi:hypothetical protein